ncbi:MAG: hypothetical protein RL596_2408, partial [Bacteroidota bacterium]
RRQIKAWQEQKDLDEVLKGKELESYYNNAFFKEAAVKQKTTIKNSTEFGYYFAFGDGLFYSWTDKEYTPEEKKVLDRFRSIIALTFRRFLDLQKAESQAREAQIEAVMERVRARSMAMQKPEELIEVAMLLRKEMGGLGVEELETSSIYIIGKNNTTECWYALKDLRKNTSILISDEMTLQLNETWVGKQMWQFYQSTKNQKSIPMQGEQRKEWINYCASHSKVLKGYYGKDIPDRNYHLVKFNDGFIGAATIGDINAESWGLLKRAAAVFSLAYTRFKDLQEAAANAWEARIELALERVRARTMAMHNSKDVGESVAAMFDELAILGVLTAEDRCGIGIMQPNEMMELWTAEKTTGKTELTIGYLNMRLHKLLKNVYRNWLDQKEMYQYILQGIDKEKYYEAMRNQENYKIKKDYYSSQEKIVHTDFFFKEGCLYVFSQKQFTEESISIFIRFSNVFGQTYRRYLDLQKAEAQAREAEIQLALERVRARTMAMRHSTELSETATELFLQLKKLGAELWTCGFALCEKNNELVEKWMGSPITGHSFKRFVIPYTANDGEQSMYDAWQNGIDLYTYIQEGEELKAIYDELMNVPSFRENYKELIESGMSFPTWQKFYIASYKYGYLLIITTHFFEEEDIFKRFAKVFEQTYTRFLDLQKAETQAREAQIEASLEKVRSVAMSMHHSNELLNICEAIYTELLKLGITELRNTMINIHNDADETFLNYDYSAYGGRAVTKYGYHIHPVINHLVMQSRSTQDAFVDVAFVGEEFEAWRNFRKSSGEKDDKRLNKITHLHYYFYSIGIGSIGVSTFESIDEQKLALLKRFRNVFQLAYQRFTDLTAAEAQAREAQIEMALERVRSRTMAMQKSEQLPETAQVLFEQFAAFGKIPDRMSIGIIKEEKQVIEWWLTDQTGGQLTSRFDASFNGPTISQYFVGWKEGQDSLVIELSGEPLKEWVAFVRDKVKLPIDESKMKGKRVHHAAFFSQGLLLITAHEQMPEETMKLLTRFAKVFSQTYTRFLDLQTAEAAAKEAIKQAALDRIRADIASMRTKEDLNRITPLIWNELTILGIPFIRCGVFMMDEAAAQIHTFLSTPTGEAIAAFHLGFQEFENIKNIVHHWRTKQAYINHWGRNEFAELAESLITQGSIANKEQYLQSLPATGIHLNFIPF